jgi:predicted dehydrogenase
MAEVSEPLRVAVAGTGFIGRVHARSARLAGATLVGVTASTPERSVAASAELGSERFFERSEDLVVADDVDVVHICTPNHLHEPLAMSALESGKHVICEKPLALDASGAERLTAAAKSAGTVAAVPFVYRYYATVREARARVDTGEIGDIRLIHGGYLQDWLLTPEDANWRVHEEFGGASRAFADIGSHWCDLVEFVTGHRITHVTAELLIAVPERFVREHQDAFSRGSSGGEKKSVTTEDAAIVTLRTDRGAIGSVVVSQISAGRKNQLRFEIDGSQATLAFDQENPESLWIGQQDRATLLPRAPELLSKAAAPYATLPAGHPLGYHDCFDSFVKDTYEAIRNGVPDGLPDFAAGLRTTRITDAVLRSGRSGQTVEVEE